MRHILNFSLISLLAVLAAACGSSAPPADTTTAKAESTCQQPATPPKEGETPTCSEGCKWNGTTCSAERGIIIHDNNGGGGNPHGSPPGQTK